MSSNVSFTSSRRSLNQSEASIKARHYCFLLTIIECSILQHMQLHLFNVTLANILRSMIFAEINIDQ